MGNRWKAEDLLGKVGVEGHYLTDDGIASAATAYAVLALLDYFQDLDGQEPVFDPTSPQVIVLQNRIRHLEEDLEGARAALRARDAEITTTTFTTSPWSDEVRGDDA